MVIETQNKFVVSVPEDVLTENDLPELLKLLSDVVDWHGLGLVLGIPFHKLQMIESDLSVVPVGRTLRLLSCVLVEWMQNHQEATWSALVYALSSIGKRPAARRIAHEYGKCVYNGTLWLLLAKD